MAHLLIVGNAICGIQKVGGRRGGWVSLLVDGFNGSILFLFFYVVPLFCHVFMTMTQLFHCCSCCCSSSYYYWGLGHLLQVWIQNKRERERAKRQVRPSWVHYIINVISFVVIYETEYVWKGMKIVEKAAENTSNESKTNWKERAVHKEKEDRVT